jgi:hypothetical protein
MNILDPNLSVSISFERLRVTTSFKSITMSIMSVTVFCLLLTLKLHVGVAPI